MVTKQQRLASDKQKYDLFVQRTADVLGIKPARVGEYASARSKLTARINRLRVDIAVSPDELIRTAEQLGLNVKPVPWFRDGVIYSGDKAQLVDSSLVRDGHLFIQNASSWLPVIALEVAPEHSVLDACAAPGGKSSHIATYLADAKMLWLNDGIESRIHKIRDVQNVLGFVAGNITSHPTQYIDKFVDATFDRILLDVQCSGEGMVDLARPNALEHWSPERINKYRRLQTKMLDACFKLLKPGGRLVYSTCTFSPEENEAPIATLLSRRESAEVAPMQIDFDGVDALPGVTKWGSETYASSLKLARRIRPNEYMEGFFVCAIEKRDSRPDQNARHQGEVI